MLVPKGRLVKICQNKNPREFLDENITGYVQFSWRKNGDLYIGTVVMHEGSPVLASVENVKSRSEVKGDEALEIIKNVDNAAVEMYELTQYELELTLKTNGDARVVKCSSAGSGESGKTDERAGEKAEKTRARSRSAEEPGTSRVKEEKVRTDSGTKKQRKLKPLLSGVEANVREYISSLGSFTGVLQAEGINGKCAVLLKNGNVVGVEVVAGDDVYRGNIALPLLDFRGKITLYKDDVDTLLEQYPEVRVLNREELMRKYNIRPPTEEEIEQLIKSAFYEEFEEAGLSNPAAKKELPKKQIAKIFKKENVKTVKNLLSSAIKKKFLK